jgi:hypothetical protein
MKRFLLIASILATGLCNAQTVYFDYYSEELNYNCDVFATTVNVEGYAHKTTVGDPTWTGTILLLPTKNTSTGTALTEYQIVYPFHPGISYAITVDAQTSGNYPERPEIYIGLNHTELTHNQACGGGPQQYTSPFPAKWPEIGTVFNTGQLTQNYASVTIGARPTGVSSDPINVYLFSVEIKPICAALAAPAQPTGFIFPLNIGGSSYGYLLDWEPIPGALSYEIEWYDVTLGSPANLFTATNTFYLNTNFTRGHEYKFRVRGRMETSCAIPGNWSEYSNTLPLPVPFPFSAVASLTLTQGCGGSACNQATLQWKATPGATRYKIEYVVQNAAMGISQPPVTVYSNTPSAIAKYAVNGAGWTIQYRVSAYTGKGFQPFSERSKRFSIR